MEAGVDPQQLEKGDAIPSYQEEVKMKGILTLSIQDKCKRR